MIRKEKLLPFPSITTDRLVLRKIEITDAIDMYNVAKDNEVCVYSSWGAHKTPKDSEAFISSFIDTYNLGSCTTWGITLNDNNKLIGLLTARPANIQSRCEIGYWLGKD